MSNFECIGNACPAKNYCLALTMNGQPMYDGAAEQCALPQSISTDRSLLGRNRTKVSMNVHEDVTDPELINDLAQAALKSLEKRPSPEVSDLIDLHEITLTAKMDLWSAMLNAPKQGRTFTYQEKIFYEQRIEEAKNAVDTYEITGKSSTLFAKAGFDKRCLEEYGVMFDENTEAIISRVVGNIMDGRPSLLKGDKGIAKTALAKLISMLNSPEKEPLIISGHGDMDTSELMGEVQLKDGKTYFREGIIPQAAREGRVVIIDEGNVTDTSVMLRLQDILLNMQPGKKLSLQENGGEAIEIQPGFGIISTVNEASKRYKHRQIADPANRDRYDVIPVEYPDMHSLPGEISDILERDITNLRRLAYAALSDKNGNINGALQGDEVERITILAAATQYLYSKPPISATEKFSGSSSTTAALTTEPLMSDCITPRRLYTELSAFAPQNKTGLTKDSLIESMIRRLDEGDQTHNSKIARMLLNDIYKKSI